MLHRLARPNTRSVLGEHGFADAPRVVIPIFRLQNVDLRKHGQRRSVTVGKSRRDLLIHRQRFIRLTHRVQISRHCHFRCAHELMLAVLRDESFERLVRFSESLFLPLRFGKQNVRIGAGRRIGVTSDYLFVLLRGIRARQRG